MPDKYWNFSELSKTEVRDRDFLIRHRKHEGTIAVIAPHGGGIEPGTSEIADAIAGNDLSFYTFEGIKPRGNSEMHITSTRFDEPECLSLVKESASTVSVHGEDSARDVVFLGGRDTAMLKRLREQLAAHGFTVEIHDNPLLQGIDRDNICNRAQSGCGVQMELSNGLRRSFFTSMTRTGRKTTTPRFASFVTAVRTSILNQQNTEA